MKRFFLPILFLALVPSASLVAQEHVHDEVEEHQHVEGHMAAVASMAPLYEMVKGYLIAIS